MVQRAAGKIVAICISPKRGMQKKPVESAHLVAGSGIEGDAHAGDWHRQVSLLAAESIETIRRRGVEVSPGAFAENIITEGIDLPALSVGDRLTLGEAQLEVTQIGKECHSRCAIYEQAGDCVMPREGIFARVIRGGTVQPGDRLIVDSAAASPAGCAGRPDPAIRVDRKD
ncbi:MAG: MOSC domain-containing protein [Candidatus Glassbacteria bacterium]